MPPPAASPAPLSPRRLSALIAAGGLVAVVLGFAVMRFQGFAEGRSMVGPGVTLLGWIVLAVGLYGVLVGERAETSILFRVLRIFFIVVIAFPGMFATVALGMRGAEPPPAASP